MPRRLFAPLHGLFKEAIDAGDRVGALVIQCLIVESFAVAAYRCYLRGVRGDLEAIGIDPADLAGEFVVRFQAALEAVGFAPLQTRRLMARLAAVTSPA